MMTRLQIHRCAPLVPALVCAAALAGQASMSSAAEPPASAPRAATETLLPGDYWVSEVRDEIVGRAWARRITVTEVTATAITTEETVEATGQKQGYKIYDRSWNLIDGGAQRYETNDGSGPRLPLAVGKTWSFKSGYVMKKTGESFVLSGASKVAAQESTTTGAGTFDTFRIESSVTFRSAADPSRITKITNTSWYAPAVSHWVRRTSETRTDGHLVQSGSETITSYGRRKADPPPPRRDAHSLEPVAMEEPMPGDYWTYDGGDEIRGTTTRVTSTVTKVTPDEITVATMAENAKLPRTRVYDRFWNIIENDNLKFTPNDGTGIRLPLAVGKTWSYKCSVASKSDNWSHSGTSKVAARDSVTTAAGTFETFRIETSTSVKNVANPSEATNVTTVTWYAPAIDHFVKRTLATRIDGHLTQSSSQMLVSYGRRQANASAPGGPP